MIDYRGRRVVVAGGGGTGMGAATARLAAELGAEVVVFDIQPRSAGDIRCIQVDLGDPAAIDQAVERELEPPVHGLFNCQGIAGSAPGSRASDVLRVNFLGVRLLTERVLPLMSAGGAVASIASAGGLGWPRRLERIEAFLAETAWEGAMRWLETAGSDLVTPVFPGAYSFSKQVLIVWTMRRATTAIAAGVRINCTSPGSTRTTMATEFPAQGIEFINRPSGRESAPEEQAWPLLFLNSDRASYINGVNLSVDGGHAAARALGLLSTQRA
jgi:NAD(P)-dependent dehydrogenase (short-subunit alcohol dehydrogenase family)